MHIKNTYSIFHKSPTNAQKEYASIHFESSIGEVSPAHSVNISRTFTANLHKRHKTLTCCSLRPTTTSSSARHQCSQLTETAPTQLSINGQLLLLDLRINYLSIAASSEQVDRCGPAREFLSRTSQEALRWWWICYFFPGNLNSVQMDAWPISPDNVYNTKKCSDEMCKIL